MDTPSDILKARKTIASHEALWASGIKETGEGVTSLLPVGTPADIVAENKRALLTLGITPLEPDANGDGLWGGFRGALQVVPADIGAFSQAIIKGKQPAAEDRLDRIRAEPPGRGQPPKR